MGGVKAYKRKMTPPPFWCRLTGGHYDSTGFYNGSRAVFYAHLCKRCKVYLGPITVREMQGPSNVWESNNGRIN